MSNHTKRKEEIAHLHKQNSDQRNEIKRLKFELVEAKDSLQANVIKYNDRNGELTLSNSKLISGVFLTSKIAVKTIRTTQIIAGIVCQ